MRKFGFLVVAILLAGIVAGGVSASSEYKEVQENEYWVSWDGSANVSLKTTLYGPEEALNGTKESILEVGVENATRMFLSQKQQALSRLGLTLENATVEISGHDTTGPITVAISGVIPGLARYYSYDDAWEVSLDVLRVLDLSQFDPTTINGSMHLENYFTVHLPEGAEVKNVTKGFKVESGGSYIQLDVEVDGTTITAHSVIYFKDGVTTDDLTVLYSKLGPVTIKYGGKAGVEEYSTWVMRIYNNITVDEDRTILESVEEYVEPESYVNYLKAQFAYLGLQQAEQSLYQSYARTFQSRGVNVLSGNVSIQNVESTGPLVVRYRWNLQGFVSKVNDTYIYEYDPRLEFGNISFSHRLNAALNETKVTRIKLPEGYEFTKLPGNIEAKTDAGSVVMKVTKLSENEVLIESNVYLRYGVPADDYRALMAQVPEKVEFGYVVKAEEASGVCGPAFVVGLAVLPLLLRRRR
ncbi:hypothetical protein TEU_10050 [Thermococcus eurythermalis]|uniref:Uncharacterized protein n=1 Tax=Thermococcus eurythermalis TaxID=1505907 RepID=A0A097QW22_9EURY|nr:CGP-CTERM sorting domain-containing protein [Thermococcus eurythermalis]AIU70646.1 hypothetical protein TEU_10050 [Thermococcus eurythermalis]